jgi:glycosyltransferase involved in cell wall biosynthesis
VRIILVGNTIPPDTVGGLPRYVRELAGALSRAGCETIVLAKRAAAPAPRVQTTPDGVRIVRHTVPSKRNPLFGATYPLYSARGVLGPVRSARGPDTVVHGHFPVTALPLALSGIPFLLTFHAPLWRELLDERQGTYRLPPWLQGSAVAAVRASERLVVRRAARTFVLSQFMREQLGELSARVAAETQLLPGGIDIELFSPDSASTRAGAGSPLLFAARRLTPRTGVDRLLSALPQILRAHPGATLAVAGAGEMEGELRKLAARLGISARVRFLGILSDRSLVDWYRRATLVVMPTVKLEGFGLSTAEALACGTPVIGTPVGAIPELLGPIDPALIARDSTAPALADAVTRLLEDRGRLAAIASRCRTRVAPAMGWDAIAARYLEAYEAVLSGPAPPCVR